MTTIEPRRYPVRMHGAFARGGGLFDRMTGRKRVVVLLDRLGRKVRALLDEMPVTAA